MKEGSRFDLVSREGALVVNNLLLSVILGVVFVGTLYPLAAEAVTGDKLSVGPPYFNSAAGPVALLLAAIMGVGALLRWRSDRLKALSGRVAIPILVSAIALFALVLFAPGIGLLPLLGLILAPGVAAASLAPLWGRNLRRTPLFTWGMVTAHLGIAVALAGMASESAFIRETLVAASPGQSANVGPFTVRFDWCRADCRAELDGGGGAADGAARGGRAFRDGASGADVQHAADADQRGGDRHALGRPALYRDRRGGCAGPLAIAAVVEALGDPDLVRRHRSSRSAAFFR